MLEKNFVTFKKFSYYCYLKNFNAVPPGGRLNMVYFLS